MVKENPYLYHVPTEYQNFFVDYLVNNYSLLMLIFKVLLYII
jgi:hypothetical protein